MTHCRDGPASRCATTDRGNGSPSSALRHRSCRTPRWRCPGSRPRRKPAAVVERLRAASALPPGDYVALDEGVDADGARLPAVGPPPRWTALERAAAIAQASVYVGASPTGCAVASAYGRPSVWTGPTAHTPAFAISAGGGSLAATIQRARGRQPGEAAIAEQLAELDAALDELAKLLDASVPADGRTERVLRVRLREEERVAAKREQELADYNASLNNEIVSVGPRYTALWRKIHAGDRHYNWHRIRADRAEADVDKLWGMHERTADHSRQARDPLDQGRRQSRARARRRPARRRRQAPTSGPKVPTRTLPHEPRARARRRARSDARSHRMGTRVRERHRARDPGASDGRAGRDPGARPLDGRRRLPREVSGRSGSLRDRDRTHPREPRQRGRRRRRGVRRSRRPPAVPTPRDDPRRRARPRRRHARRGRRTRSPTSPTPAGPPRWRPPTAPTAWP